MTVDGRAVLALLANDETRRLFALISLGQPVTIRTKRDTRALGRLVDAGLVAGEPPDPDRIELLEWVGRRILQPGERVDERELNARLHPLMHEHVLLRRYLIDYRVLDRSPDGSWYELALPHDAAGASSVDAGSA